MIKELMEKFKDIPEETIGVLAIIGVLVGLFTDLNTLMWFCLATFLLIFCRKDK